LVLALLKFSAVSATGFLSAATVAAIAELICAALLLFFRTSRVTHLALLALASLFLGAALVGLATNRACDCFGRIEASPFDRVLVSALLLTSGLFLQNFVNVRWVAAFILAWALVGAGAELLSDASETKPTVSSVMPRELRTGDWDVTLVRSTCPACFDHLRRRVASDARPANSKTALLIIGPSQPWLSEFYTDFDKHFEVPEARATGIRTPQQVAIRSGSILKEAKHGR
jgi:hypothetical protein